MIVLDASIVIELLLRLPRADLVHRRLRTEISQLYVPHLMDVEVGQVLRRFMLRGEISASRARQALADLELLPISRCAHLPLLQRAFQFASNLTVYDAVYLALAESLEASLLTLDKALLSANAHHVHVELLG
ncbi:MAG: type II toxin-antitoxin system VapC family toxin [Myxococcales bacterium]|nr:type II toxin-antitoxin system VapC family toxin [Myxococcales bacterium]MCB9708318.1 type II toxin-antitoxin system VapC family toxin [Myxococcales bacterium]